MELLPQVDEREQEIGHHRGDREDRNPDPDGVDAFALGEHGIDKSNRTSKTNRTDGYSIGYMFARIKNSLALNVLLLIAAGAVGIGAVRMARQTLALRAELAAAEARLEEVKRGQAELAARLAELDTPEAVEREAKAKLNLKKPGEEVVVVVPPEAPAGPQPPSPTWRQRVKQFFISPLP